MYIVHVGLDLEIV